MAGWIYNYLCDQYILPLTLWVRLRFRRGLFNTIFCEKVCQWLTTGWWFSLGILVSSTNKTDRHDITEILLKVALNTINQSIFNFELLLQISDGVLSKLIPSSVKPSKFITVQQTTIASSLKINCLFSWTDFCLFMLKSIRTLYL